jgi:hypothetical protein
MTDMDDLNAGNAAHCSEAIDAIHDGQPVRHRQPITLDKAVLQIDVEERRALRNYVQLQHVSPPRRNTQTFARRGHGKSPLTGYSRIGISTEMPLTSGGRLKTSRLSGSTTRQ